MDRVLLSDRNTRRRSSGADDSFHSRMIIARRFCFGDISHPCPLAGSALPPPAERTRGRQANAWLRLPDTGSMTAGGAATALVLATSGRLASPGRVDIGRGALADGVRASFPNGDSWRRRHDARPTTKRVWPGVARVERGRVTPAAVMPTPWPLRTCSKRVKGSQCGPLSVSGAQCGDSERAVLAGIPRMSR
jgi:hypothetical protein